MEQISKGDVVCLKSDFNRISCQCMTVEDIDNDGICYCVWFKDGELRKASLSIQALTRC
ncbi:hypothetical protein [Prevotella melaninogenica]|uniref:hypothetical protein n=1 Tax=Prevotella melaninogenica TaxID=28132 RepID=UPI00242E8CD5|nr:hypothetical protein [Prevotella melaninogenica]